MFNVPIDVLIWQFVFITALIDFSLWREVSIKSLTPGRCGCAISVSDIISCEIVTICMLLYATGRRSS